MAAEHQTSVKKVPIWCDNFQGFNDIKRKKIKEQPMRQESLKFHSDKLFSICLRPSMSCYKAFCEKIVELAECLKSYGEYLQVQLDSVKHNQSLSHPVREVATSCFVKHRKPPSSDNNVSNIYHPLDYDLKHSELLEPVLFDESKHLTEPFSSPLQRFSFISKLSLSMPVDTLHYCPGGSTYGILYVWRVDPNRTVDDDKLQTSRMVAKLQPLLPVYHTRQMKKDFKKK
jgi:hypothetical protein